MIAEGANAMKRLWLVSCAKYIKIIHHSNDSRREEEKAMLSSSLEEFEPKLIQEAIRLDDPLRIIWTHTLRQRSFPAQFQHVRADKAYFDLVYMEGEE